MRGELVYLISVRRGHKKEIIDVHCPSHFRLRLTRKVVNGLAERTC